MDRLPTLANALGVMVSQHGAVKIFRFGGARQMLKSMFIAMGLLAIVMTAVWVARLPVSPPMAIGVAASVAVFALWAGTREVEIVVDQQSASVSVSSRRLWVGAEREIDRNNAVLAVQHQPVTPGSKLGGSTVVLHTATRTYVLLRNDDRNRVSRFAKLLGQACVIPVRSVEKVSTL